MRPELIMANQKAVEFYKKLKEGIPVYRLGIEMPIKYVKQVA